MVSIVLLKAVLAFVSALTGAVIIFFVKFDHEKLCSAISFSAGALFGAAIFAILPETAENLTFLEMALSAASGYLLFYLVSKYYSHICPACSASHFDEQTTKKFSEIVKALMVALSFHSFLDGVAISSTGSSVVNETNSIFIAITTHKFPEGLALASLMIGANYKKPRIFLSVFMVELTTVIGAIVGATVLADAISTFWMAIIMAHIAGGFVFLAFHAIMGEMLKHHTKLVVISFSIGMLLILSVHLAFK
jgi:zinc transporter ZupT